MQAYEIQPTTHDVVHHVLVFVRAPGESLPGPEDEGIGGYFAIYVPGNAHQVFADGFAKRIPAAQAAVPNSLHAQWHGHAGPIADRVRVCEGAAAA